MFNSYLSHNQRVLITMKSQETTISLWFSYGFKLDEMGQYFTYKWKTSIFSTGKIHYFYGHFQYRLAVSTPLKNIFVNCDYFINIWTSIKVMFQSPPTRIAMFTKLAIHPGPGRNDASEPRDRSRLRRGLRRVISSSSMPEPQRLGPGP